ncbi:MAG TPA: alpha-amylase family glycosyl hydrolase, partial [Oleiagrimonas sp.]|nr:alpha-amylase family glycosyl hydrolase [Oleiagrimonas sp.]
DTNGDGIGDLDGVTAKLDYLKSLGVDGIWLMPINPSPSYHGYDVTNYKAVNPQYGTLADFRQLTAAAHQRGIRVIIDMVVNHSSNENPWFKSALNPKSPYRDWYTWAGKYTDLETPNAFGAQSWQTSANGQHYLGIFSPTMPDLNFDNPAVRKQIIKVGQFWLKQGADGFRLDAARHIYVNFASDVGAPAAIGKNIAWWQQYRQGLDKINPHTYLVGEVTRDEAADLAPYLKPLTAVFNFPLATKLIKAAKSGRNQDLARTLEHTYATYRKGCGCDRIHDAPFLSNHDQERVMSQLGGNMHHMRVAAAMLLTLPGEPYIYYGEELGMRGTKPDPELRTPMRWDRTTHAHGEATWEATATANGAAISVAAQRDNPHSLLELYQRLIHWRIDVPALRDGGFRAYPESSDHLLAFERTMSAGTVLVVHNLSGKTQTMTLDVPGEPSFTRIVKQTTQGASLDGVVLEVPAYDSVVLQ